MTVTINKSKEVFEYFKSKIASVKSNEHLSPEGKAAALKEIDAELGAQLSYWEEEVAKEKELVEAEGALTEAVSESNSWSTKLIATERVIADIKASISADVHTADGNPVASVW